MIGSLAMAMRYSLDQGELADKLEGAVAAVLGQGLRTGDIAAPGTNAVGTGEMGDAVLAALQAALH
jgi:3-isopropylmalate dehydrogenase